MVKKTTLSNGLRVLAVPQEGVRSATVLVLVGTGSKYETKKTNGLAHFLEHMFFQGTRNRPTPKEVLEVLDRVGGMYNAFTAQDYTGYFAKVDASHVGLALEWVADILLNSLFLPQAIEKEKGPVIEELNLYHDNPAMHIGELWPQLLYGDQPAGWKVIGTKATVESFQRKDLTHYVKTHYVAPNTVVCAAGNIEPQDILSKVTQLFRRLPPSPFPKKPKVDDSQKKLKVLLESRKIDQTHIALGARAYSLFHPKRYARDLLSVILGGMMSSRLAVEIREKRGWAYDISTQSEMNPDTGWIVTAGGIKTAYIEKVIQIIAREYKKIATTLVSSKELEKVKEHSIGQMALRLESSDANAFFYGTQELLENNVLTPEDIYAKIQKVEAQEIRAVAHEVFRRDKMNLAILGPFENKEPFEKLLKHYESR